MTNEEQKTFLGEATQSAMKNACAMSTAIKIDFTIFIQMCRRNIQIK